MTILWPFVIAKDTVGLRKTSVVVWCSLMLAFIVLMIFGFQNAMVSSQQVPITMVRSHDKREAPIVEVCDYFYLPGFGSKSADAWESDWKVDGVQLENITELHLGDRAKFHIRYRTQSLDQDGKTKKEDTVLKLDSSTFGFSVNYVDYHDKYPCLQLKFTPDIEFRSEPQNFIFDKLRIYAFFQHRSARGNRPLVWRAVPPGGDYKTREKLALDKFISSGAYRISAKVNVRTHEYASQDIFEAMKRKVGFSVHDHQSDRYEFVHWETIALTPEWMQWYYWPLLLRTLGESSQLPPMDSYDGTSDFNKLQFVGVEFEFETMDTEAKTEKNFTFSLILTMLGSFVAAAPIFSVMGEIWCVDVIATVKQKKQICRVPMWRRLKSFQDKSTELEGENTEDVGLWSELTQEMHRFGARSSARTSTRRRAARPDGDSDELLRDADVDSFRPAREENRNPLFTALRPVSDSSHSESGRDV